MEKLGLKSMGWKECGLVGSNSPPGVELPSIQRKLLGDVLQTFTGCSLLEQVSRPSSCKASPLNLGLLGPGLDSCPLSSWGADSGVCNLTGSKPLPEPCVTQGLLGYSDKNQ